MSDVEIIEPNKGGRPSEFSEEIFDRICDRMSEGAGLREICAEPGMPSRSTVLRWIKDNKERSDHYQQAREAGFDWIAEEIIRISDDATGDNITEERDGKSVTLPNHANVQRARLQVDSRKWILSKIAPRKYGDKVELLTATAEPGAAGDNQATVFKWADSVRVVVYPMLRPDGTLIPKDTPEYDAAIERAANERRKAHADPLTGRRETSVGIPLDDEPSRQPAQLTYQPDPLPGDLSPEDWSLLTEVLNLIKRTIPSDDSSPPDAIFRILREALLLHFREVEIEAGARN